MIREYLSNAGVKSRKVKFTFRDYRVKSLYVRKAEIKFMAEIVFSEIYISRLQGEIALRT